MQPIANLLRFIAHSSEDRAEVIDRLKQNIEYAWDHQVQKEILEAVLALVEMPEDSVSEEPERNFMEEAHNATYQDPDHYVSGVSYPTADPTGPDWEPGDDRNDRQY